MANPIAFKKTIELAPREPNEFDRVAALIAQHPTADVSWVQRARVYHAEGHLNFSLFQAFAQSSLWKLEAGRRPIYAFTKQCFDRIAALSLLIFFFPLHLVCALAIKINSPGPIFFRQLRIGQLGKPFWIYKFRTMHVGSEQLHRFDLPLAKIPTDNRSTSIGLFLRKRKFDELPQLLNVLNGEMSLVGPRPLTIEESATTPQRYICRFAVPPGITGLWQATRLNTITGVKKLALDAHYVQRRSWVFDIVLLLKTVRVFVRGERSL